MLNISFLACSPTKVEVWYLKVCIVVNGEKFKVGPQPWSGDAQYRTCPRYFHIL